MGDLSEATELMTPSDIVTATGLGRQNVDQLLHRMHSDGEIIKRRFLYVCRHHRHAGNRLVRVAVMTGEQVGKQHRDQLSDYPSLNAASVR